jgi:hypothetical protein
MKLTIFGSCRQDSLYTVYDCTSIQKTLTYPHYTKEVIQAIKFCSGHLQIDPDLARWVFRSGILDSKSIHASAFKAEFVATDLFVIEIASRISYEYAGLHAHHILTEPKYGFTRISDIVQRDLTDDEIEQDLVEMKELLYPKKMMIVSHIYSRREGKRYELVQLLSRLCQTHGIPFFDPVEQLEGNPPGAYMIEDVLAHYSDHGHALIRQKYKSFIDRLSLVGC